MFIFQLKLFHDNEKSSEAEENKHLISLTRKSREQHINIIPFSHEGVPQPFDQSAAIAKYIESKLITQSDVDALVKVGASDFIPKRVPPLIVALQLLF